MPPRTHYPPSFKHKVLSEYQPNQYGCGFEALAKKYSIQGGKSVVCRWYAQWNGTVESLEEKKHTGRKHKLSEEDTQQLIEQPVEEALQKKQKINYSDIHQKIQSKPAHSDISLRTVQRIGKRELGLRWKRTTLDVEQNGIARYPLVIVSEFCCKYKHVEKCLMQIFGNAMCM
jgi:transposase